MKKAKVKSIIDDLVGDLHRSPKLMPDAKYVISDDEIILKLSNFNDVGARDHEGKTLLMYAVLYEREKIVEYLLKRNVDVNASEKSDYTALHFAAQAGNAGIVKMLLESGANAKAKDSYGNIPLLRCSINTSFDAISVLLEYGSDPYEKNNYGVSAVDIWGTNHRFNDIMKYRAETACVNPNKT